MAEDRELTIEQERAAFDDLLRQLLPDHEGEFALLKGGELLGLYASHAEAFQAGLDRFGPKTIYLVQEIQPDRPEPTNFAWQSGLLIG